MVAYLETANGNIRVPAAAYNVTGNLVDVRRPKRQKGDELKPISIKRPLKPHAGQKPIWYDEKTRNQILLAGSQGGKSHIGPPWLWREIERTIKEGGLIEGKEYLFGIVAPSFKIQKQATVGIARMVRFLCAKFDCPEDLILNKQDLRIDLRPLKKTHGLDYPVHIHAGSAERVNSLQGARLEAAWIDEGGLVQDEGIYLITKQRLWGHGRLLVTTTPYVQGLWLKEIIDNVKKGVEPDTIVVRFPSIVNPYFSLKSETNLRDEFPAWYFNMMYNAQFEQPHGLVYPDVTYVPPFTIPRHWPRILGVDPTQGGPDEFAAVWMAHDPFEPEIWFIYREFYLACRPKLKALDQTYRSPHEMLDIIHEMSVIETYDEDGVITTTKMRESVGRIFSDPAKPETLYDLEVRFPEAQVFKADPKLSGLTDVGRKLKIGQLRVFSNLVNWASEQANYIYPYSKFGEVVSSDPIDRNNHLMDASRYAIRQSDAARNLAEPSFA